MKNLKSLLVLMLLGTILSCQHEGFRPEPLKSTLSINGSALDSQLKWSFGNSLSHALVADKDLRGFLKQQALKMMDADYDILYALVKNERLANGKTFRETLATYFRDPAELTKIEANLPLLTIFIPRCPKIHSLLRNGIPKPKFLL